MLQINIIFKTLHKYLFNFDTSLSISFVLRYFVVLEKLNDTCFFWSARIGCLGMKTTSENWGTQYQFNFII